MRIRPKHLKSENTPFENAIGVILWLIIITTITISILNHYEITDIELYPTIEQKEEN